MGPAPLRRRRDACDLESTGSFSMCVARRESHSMVRGGEAAACARENGNLSRHASKAPQRGRGAGCLDMEALRRIGRKPRSGTKMGSGVTDWCTNGKEKHHARWWTEESQEDRGVGGKYWGSGLRRWPWMCIASRHLSAGGAQRSEGGPPHAGDTPKPLIPPTPSSRLQTPSHHDGGKGYTSTEERETARTAATATPFRIMPCILSFMRFRFPGCGSHHPKKAYRLVFLTWGWLEKSVRGTSSSKPDKNPFVAVYSQIVLESMEV